MSAKTEYSKQMMRKDSQLSDLTCLTQSSRDELEVSHRFYVPTAVVSVQYDVPRVHGGHPSSPLYNQRYRRPNPVAISTRQSNSSTSHRLSLRVGGGGDMLAVDCMVNAEQGTKLPVHPLSGKSQEDEKVYNRNQCDVLVAHGTHSVLSATFCEEEQVLVKDHDFDNIDIGAVVFTMKARYTTVYKDYKIPNQQCVRLRLINVSNISLQVDQSSSSTPTVPYSTADILYGNEVRHSPQLDEIRQNSFIDFTKERERQNSRDLGDRRPSSKGGSRKSLSIEKVFGKDSEDNIRQSLPSTRQNQYRPNGLRNTLLKGEPLFSTRNNASAGRDTDQDLVAMGTIWSPNAPTPAKNNPASASTPNPANSTASGTMQSVASNKTVSVGTTGSSSSTAISQTTRKYGSSNVRPIMVQNAPTSRNNVKDAEPKYTDPLIGAPASFQQRLMELSALEAETVRYEKNKRVKKRVKQDRDS